MEAAFRACQVPPPHHGERERRITANGNRVDSGVFRSSWGGGGGRFCGRGRGGVDRSDEQKEGANE